MVFRLLVFDVIGSSGAIFRFCSYVFKVSMMKLNVRLAFCEPGRERHV